MRHKKRRSLSYLRRTTAQLSLRTNMRRGALIVFEGADKAGKTTQCAELYFALRQLGIPVARIAFPLRDPQSPLSSTIMTCLNGEAKLHPYSEALLFAAERFTKQKEITDALEAGMTVLIDRYLFSGIAYASAAGVGRKFCFDINYGLLMPDLVILLDSTVDLFAERKLDLHEQPGNVGVQRIVISEYKDLAQPEWLVLDASEPSSELRDAILRRALSIIYTVADLKTFQKK